MGYVEEGAISLKPTLSFSSIPYMGLDIHENKNKRGTPADPTKQIDSIKIKPSQSRKRQRTKKKAKLGGNISNMNIKKGRKKKGFLSTSNAQQKSLCFPSSNTIKTKRRTTNGVISSSAAKSRQKLTLILIYHTQHTRNNTDDDIVEHKKNHGFLRDIIQLS